MEICCSRRLEFHHISVTVLQLDVIYTVCEWCPHTLAPGQLSGPVHNEKFLYGFSSDSRHIPVTSTALNANFCNKRTNFHLHSSAIIQPKTLILRATLLPPSNALSPIAVVSTGLHSIQWRRMTNGRRPEIR